MRLPWEFDYFLRDAFPLFRFRDDPCQGGPSFKKEIDDGIDADWLVTKTTIVPKIYTFPCH